MFIVEPGLYRIYCCFIFLASENLCLKALTGFAERDKLYGSERGGKTSGVVLIPSTLDLKRNPSHHCSTPAPIGNTHLNYKRPTFSIRIIRSGSLFEKKIKLKILKTYNVNNKMSCFSCD